MSQSQAEPTKAPWVNHFFAILPDATGAAILMLPSTQGWRLPYVRSEERIWLSEAARIIQVLRNALDVAFDFTILRYAAIEENETERWTRLLLVLEPREPIHHPPLGGQWTDHATLQAMALALPEQRAPLLHYLAENEQGVDSPLIDPRRSPWARPGWFASASAWIEEAIVELGYTQTGPVQQLRNWSISSVLFAPTSAGRLYFKAAAALPLFVNEPALTQTLSELFPQHLPTPLKIDRARRWMLMKDFGAAAREEADVNVAPILRAYGNLQRESAGHLDELGEAGCIDRGLSVLASQIDPLLADPTTQAVLTPQDFEALVALAPQLKELCARVAEYNIPPTLLHGDLHLGNITQRIEALSHLPQLQQNIDSDYLFFDWTDACIGFPFLDHFMIYFPEQKEAEGNHRTAGVAAAATPEYNRRDAYLATWQVYESPQRLLEVWELARPLCALHHAVSYLSIVNHIEPLTRQELLHGFPDNLHRLLASIRVSKTSSA